RHSLRVRGFACMAAMIASLTAAFASSENTGFDFFERKIRPIFVERCYECHSPQAEKLKGGLLLDTKEGVLKGGDTGPAIVPGNREKSLLIKAVRYASEDLQMPPKNKKLSDEQIADLEEWVKMGAPDPRTGQGTAAPKNSASKHWAFQPVKPVPLAKVRNPRWIQSPVDTFILAKLEEKGITPNPAADKR